ncbi:2396_t:CDS:1 [Acaulospora morrowiae]|uniref:2396_t:CDS:1 n=1 Tax=Acaulospora morrowiae TaxID=94023 RepID=A0A9N9GE71_9GLOM|nr:2396_t:CDS:1 [Acaulospora morrowiae]
MSKILIIFRFLIIVTILLCICFWFEIAPLPTCIPSGPVSLERTLGFGHIYVINLPYRTDRRKKMEAIANALNLDFEIFPATSKFDKKTLDAFPGRLDAQYKACWVSHYKIFQSMMENSYDSALILEDDVDMEIDILSIMSGIHHSLPVDWEMLFLGHCGGDSKGPLLGKSQGVELYKSASPICMHAYAVSSTGLPKILREYNTSNMPIDFRSYDLIDKEVITSYSLEPSIVVQVKSYDNPSDITPESNDTETDDLRNSTLKFIKLRR